MGAVDLTGSRFGRLTVFERMPNRKDGTATWRVICDCGHSRIVEGTGLRAGRNKSCGCSSPRFNSVHGLKHGRSRTGTYKIWLGMHSRCNNPGKKSHLYFGKGVRVCDRWKDFENFLADMGDRPNGMSIDRIDGNKGYEPGNCRWATPKQQGNNTAANRILEFNGCRKTVSLWADETGIKANTIIYRLRRGWSVGRSLTTEVRKQSGD